MEQLMMNSMQDGASAFDLILGGDPALYAVIRLSLTVSVSATLLASAIGLPLGAVGAGPVSGARRHVLPVGLRHCCGMPGSAW
jgi:tungstate transport system permease protein